MPGSAYLFGFRKRLCSVQNHDQVPLQVDAQELGATGEDLFTGQQQASHARQSRFSGKEGMTAKGTGEAQGSTTV